MASIIEASLRRAPIGASRDGNSERRTERSNKVSDYRAVGGSFSSRLEAESLPAVLPMFETNANAAASAKAPAGASRDGNQRSNSIPSANVATLLLEQL